MVCPYAHNLTLITLRTARHVLLLVLQQQVRQIIRENLPNNAT
jgi:hypothetical protein